MNNEQTSISAPSDLLVSIIPLCATKGMPIRLSKTHDIPKILVHWKEGDEHTGDFEMFDKDVFFRLEEEKLIQLRTAGKEVDDYIFTKKATKK